MIEVVVAIIGLIGYQLHKYFLAYRDGAYNTALYQLTWCTLYKSGSFDKKIVMLTKCLEEHAKSNDLDIRAFTIDSAVVIQNNINRVHNRSIHTEYQGIPLEQYRESFYKKHQKSTDE